MASENGMGLNLALIVHRVMTNPRGWRVDELQEDLGIQARTYRKYRKVLRDEFAPFAAADDSVLDEVEDGDHRYLRLQAERVQETEMQEHADRITALYFARRLMAFLDQTPLGKEVESVFQELMSRVPNGSGFARRLRNVTRLFYHKPFGSKDYRQRGEQLRGLIHALLFQKVVEIEYHAASRSDHVSHREVEPLTLVSYREGLYLLANLPDGGGKRIFAIDRILAVRDTNRRFTYPSQAEYTPEAFFANAFGLYRAPKPQRRKVELIFANETWLKRDLTERMWDRSQTFQTLSDGRLRMVFKPESLVEVRSWIASFGNNVEIVKPAPLDDPIWFAGHEPDDEA